MEWLQPRRVFLSVTIDWAPVYTPIPRRISCSLSAPFSRLSLSGFPLPPRLVSCSPLSRPPSFALQVPPLSRPSLTFLSLVPPFRAPFLLRLSLLARSCFPQGGARLIKDSSRKKSAARPNPLPMDAIDPSGDQPASSAKTAPLHTSLHWSYTPGTDGSGSHGAVRCPLANKRSPHGADKPSDQMPSHQRGRDRGGACPWSQRGRDRGSASPWSERGRDRGSASPWSQRGRGRGSASRWSQREPHLAKDPRRWRAAAHNSCLNHM